MLGLDSLVDLIIALRVRAGMPVSDQFIDELRSFDKFQLVNYLELHFRGVYRSGFQCDDLLAETMKLKRNGVF